MSSSTPEGVPVRWEPWSLRTWCRAGGWCGISRTSRSPVRSSNSSWPTGPAVPSAGFSQGLAFVVLTEPDRRRLFWETTSGPEWRGESESVPLTRAPVVIVPLAHKQAYLDRYALPDKAHTPLAQEEYWPAPYWDIDTGFGVMLILLTAVDLGLGALFFGIFQGERALMAALGVPEGTDHRRHRRRLPDGRRALRTRAAHRPPPPRRGRAVGALVAPWPPGKRQHAVPHAGSGGHTRFAPTPTDLM